MYNKTGVFVQFVLSIKSDSEIVINGMIPDKWKKILLPVSRSQELSAAKLALCWQPKHIRPSLRCNSK